MAAEAGDPGPSDDELPPDPFPGDPFGDPTNATDASSQARTGPPDTDALSSLLGSMGMGGAGLAGAAALGPLFAAMGGGGGLAWDSARQIALWTAAGGSVESNVEPMERIRIEELVRSATPIVADTTGLDLPPMRVDALTRAGWAAEALDDFRDLFDQLARATGSTSSGTTHFTEPAPDPLAEIFRLVGPMMTSSAIGGLVGRVASGALGTYDLLLPRRKDRLTFVPTAVQSFASEWSIPLDRALTHLVVADLSTHAVLRIPHIVARLRDLLGRHADAARVDTDGLTRRIEDMAAGTAELDPQLLRASEPTPVQIALRADIDDLLTPVVGYVDYATMVVGARMLGDNRQVVEAWRRHRASDPDLELQILELVGVRSASSLAERGASFIGGVIERAGRDGLAALWSNAEHLPTRSELDAPGLWLARIELD